MLTITLETDSAAFASEGESEVARILRDIASRVESGAIDEDGDKIYDINGNNVGSVVFELEEE